MCLKLPDDVATVPLVSVFDRLKRIIFAGTYWHMLTNAMKYSKQTNSALKEKYYLHCAQMFFDVPFYKRTESKPNAHKCLIRIYCNVHIC